MIRMDVQVDARSATAYLRGVPTAIAGGLPATLEKIGAGLQRFVASEKLSSGGILEPRTGTLRRSLFHRVDGPSVEIGFDLGIAPYGRIQEEGGTITPKASANLAIPVGAALTAKGVARFTAREVIANPMAFGYFDTFFEKGVLFGVTAVKRHDQESAIVPLFVLKPSVTLQARAPLASTLNEKMDWILSQFDELLGTATGGNDGG